MLKYLMTVVLVSGSMAAVAMDDSMASSAPKVVARHVIAAKQASDARDHQTAVIQFTTAFSLLSKAYHEKEEVDLEGAVGAGVLREGTQTEELLYDPQSSLKKRLLNMALLVAKEAEKVRDYLVVARYYGAAGNYHQGDIPAQLHYFKSAQAYVLVLDFQEAFKKASEAAAVAGRFWQERESRTCLLPEIAQFCLEQSQSLKETNPAVASQFEVKATELQALMR